MIGLFAFPENDVAGLEAYVGNAADDGLDVLRGQINEKRVLTQNALKSLHGAPPPSMGSDWVLVLPGTSASRLHWTPLARVSHRMKRMLFASHRADPFVLGIRS
jgi:hypothetical protein